MTSVNKISKIVILNYVFTGLFFPVHVKKSYKSELYEQSNKAHIVGANIKHGK